MTISDFIQRLETLVKGKTLTSGVDRNAQVKLGKKYNDTSDVFDFFDIVRKDGDVVLVPSNAWEVKHENH